MTSDIRDKGLFREGLKVEDEVTVTLPAFVWLSFVGAYGGSDWSNMYATQVANEAQRAMLSQRVINENEAADAEAREQHQRVMSHVMTHIPGFFNPGDPRAEA